MKIETNVLLAPFTTFQIGGPAKYFCRVNSTEELQEAFDFVQAHNLSVFILGGGSNILVSDNGFDGLVIKIEIPGLEFQDIDDYTVRVIAGAGENWDRVVERTVEKKLYGIENLSNIPGTVGGAAAGNIGAYGMEVGDAIEWVEMFDPPTFSLKVLGRLECNFGYRNSFFKTEGGHALVITKVCFRLNQEGRVNTSHKNIAKYFEGSSAITLKALREAVIEIKKKKFPDLASAGTAGSFFRNLVLKGAEAEKLIKQFPDIPYHSMDSGHIKASLAYLLDTIGWKGIKRGDVGVFEHQPLVLVNFSSARAKDVKTLAEEIAQDVKNKTGITIIPEVIFVGNF